MSEQEGSAVKWEYRILTDRGRMGRVGEGELNEAGEEGWELAAVLQDPAAAEPQVNYYFKRRKG